MTPTALQQQRSRVPRNPVPPFPFLIPRPAALPQYYLLQAPWGSRVNAWLLGTFAEKPRKSSRNKKNRDGENKNMNKCDQRTTTITTMTRTMTTTS